MRKLADEGVGLGGHGTDHLPLTTVTDVDRELRDCWTAFERLTGYEPTSFAFPHGLYSQSILDATLRTGYKLVFTSDRYLNLLDRGCPVSPVLGRVALAEQDVTDSQGRFSREKFAYWLSLQPVK